MAANKSYKEYIGRSSFIKFRLRGVVIAVAITVIVTLTIVLRIYTTTAIATTKNIVIVNGHGQG